MIFRSPRRRIIAACAAIGFVVGLSSIATAQPFNEVEVNASPAVENSSDSLFSPDTAGPQNPTPNTSAVIDTDPAGMEGTVSGGSPFCAGFSPLPPDCQPLPPGGPGGNNPPPEDGIVPTRLAIELNPQASFDIGEDGIVPYRWHAYLLGAEDDTAAVLCRRSYDIHVPGGGDVTGMNVRGWKIDGTYQDGARGEGNITVTGVLPEHMPFIRFVLTCRMFSGQQEEQEASAAFVVGSPNAIDPCSVAPRPSWCGGNVVPGPGPDPVGPRPPGGSPGPQLPPNVYPPGNGTLTPPAPIVPVANPSLPPGTVLAPSLNHRGYTWEQWFHGFGFGVQGPGLWAPSYLTDPYGSEQFYPRVRMDASGLKIDLITIAFVAPPAGHKGRIDRSNMSAGVIGEITANPGVFTDSSTNGTMVWSTRPEDAGTSGVGMFYLEPGRTYYVQLAPVQRASAINGVFIPTDGTGAQQMYFVSMIFWKE